MADDSAERPKSAMIRRHEQLQRWKASELAKTSDSRKNAKTKVKFQAGCVFLAACASGDVEDVQHLLDIGADINYANIDGLTALHQAVIDENQDMVEFLLENGANIEAQDNEGWTALHAAASCGFIDIAQFLLDNGANIAAVNNEGEIPLDLAEEEDMEEFLEEEIDKAGIDAEEARSEEENIMLRDAKQWLNNKNIKEKKHPTTGAAAMHVAASKGYTKVIELLIQNHADVNMKDFDGWTPLHAASHWGQKEAVELLVENMADMEAKNKLGQTAFDLADEDDMLPYLSEMKKKQASMKKDTKPSAPRIDGKIPPPLKRSIMKRPGESQRLSITGSSVTRISMPDKNLLIHQDMEKERRELAMKIHGKSNQDKKTMESSSSSEESETETSSSEEEEEVKKPAVVPVNKKPPPNIPPVSKPPPSPAGKKELPSFSPKPLTPVKQDSKEQETPAWRTGLRKTGSTILPEPKKPEERLPRSASAPKIAEQPKPTTNNNRWQNERLANKPEDKKTITVAKPPPPRARIGEEKKEAEKPKSFMAPSKEEEAETVRKSRAKRERSSRRSTQGVTAEDIESAVSSIRNSSGDKKAQVDNKLAEKNKEEDSLEQRTTTTPRPLRAETESSVSKVSLRKPEEKKAEKPVATFTARPRLTATISNDSGSTSTVKLTPRYSSKTDDTKEKEREKEKEKDSEDKSPKKSAVHLRRKPREKRRSTGIIHRDNADEEEESESESGSEESEEEKPAPKSTDRFSRTGAASRLGDSSTATVDRYGSRGAADRNSTYSTRDKDKAASTPCASCKKIVDDKDALISKLEKDVKSKDAEIAELKSKSGTSRFSSGTSSDNDKREKRALERRISELEEEVKAVKQLKADNQRLKDENGALVRVISKLSK